MIPSTPLKLAIVGDVHDQWSAADNAAVVALGVDLVLFVGDFGNEAVDVVRCVSELSVPYAVILGNHDAWYTASAWGRKKAPYNHALEDRVQEQLTLLGDAHVGYGVRDFPALNLSVVGGRPFSWGGDHWLNPEFYQERYGIDGFAASSRAICAAVERAQCDRIIFLAHNGPTGLGNQAESICGRDWKPIGSDFGDPDLAEAIAFARAQGKPIPLVTFGHMHHTLRHRRDRLRDITQTAAETLYLNAARVPRIINTGHEQQRNFSLVTLTAGQVTAAHLVWVDEQAQIHHQEPLYPTPQTVQGLL
ncbi:TIGR04168 family protein [Spirulina major CS-329]|uniref:TIGR04168 family protein n=1 Tax=Spirulina TaxID=1154 RepID=UPI00232FA852|nr:MULTISPECIES: TIGR04168 family protein [Spirulina]MDB9493791.1 TIGR04168 family protein [Spirulina subsalsa CS-330]MDB9504943.1 TIGR04168 family protein [Spirulina major CS-329]